MKKITFYCEMEWENAPTYEEFEFDDDVTDEEIEEAMKDWALGLMSLWRSEPKSMEVVE